MLTNIEEKVILAVKNDKELEDVLKSKVEIIFVLYGSVLTVEEISKKIKGSGKIGIVHIDLIEGLSKEDASVEFIEEKTEFKGIISTRKKLLAKGQTMGLYTVLRTFVIDSMSKESIITLCKKKGTFDAVEILPGTIYKTIKEIKEIIGKPIIAGGLISTKEEVKKTFESGASFISTSNSELMN